MWFLNACTPKCPAELKQKGGFRLLLDSEVDDLTDYDIHRYIDVLWRFCPTPSVIRFPLSYFKIIEQYLNIHIQLAKPNSPIQHNAIKKLRLFLNELKRITITKSNQEQYITQNAERSSLNNHLIEYPLYTMLLFISSMSNVQEQTWWLHFLTRLQRCIGELKYEHCLELDKIRRSPEHHSSITIDNLKYDSNIELSIACDEITALIPFSHHFISEPKHIKGKPVSKPFKTVNIYNDVQISHNGLKISSLTPTDCEGNETIPYAKFSQNAGAITSKLALSQVEAKTKFRLERVGFENAIARTNRKLPMSNNILSPAELMSLLQFQWPELYDQELNLLDKHEQSHLFLMFLQMLCGRLNQDLILFNIANKQGQAPSINCITYKLDRLSSCFVQLRLSTALFKGKQPPANSKHYLGSKSYFDLTLPWPLASLLNLILRKLPPNQRHNISLYKALSISIKQQQDWLRQAIKSIKQVYPYRLTLSAVIDSFHHFCSQSFPSVFTDYARQNGNVLMHYVNCESNQISKQLQQHWFLFLEQLGLNRKLDWSVETNYESLALTTFHSQCGSAITLRPSLFDNVFCELLKPILKQEYSKTTLNTTVQRVALYLHIRSALELALRPVNAPYPLDKHCAWPLGILSVQDKRSHHVEERRLLVISDELSKLLNTYQQLCSLLCGQYQMSEHAILSISMDQQWVSISPKVFNSLCERFLDTLEPGTFRHSCASQFISLSSQTDFDQQALNLRMNHYKRGQNPLGEYSLCSISQVIKRQKGSQTILTTSHSNNLWNVISKWDQEIEQVMKQLVNSGLRL